MAYFNFLLAVPESQVDALRQDATFILKPSKVTGVSHLLGYWVRMEPLGKLLRKSLDGGQLVNEDLWHPLRPPVYHTPASVKSLHEKIAKEWNKITDNRPKDGDDFDWYRSEMSRLLPLFEHAARRGECVVSVLEPPADRQRADRARIPFEPAAEPAEHNTDSQSKNAHSNHSPFDLWEWALIPGAPILGALGLCAWRYRRIAKG